MENTQNELLVVLITYGLVFVVIEWLQAKHPIDSELARKSTHIIGGFMAAALPIVFNRWQIIGLGIVAAIAMGLSRRLNLFRSIHHPKRKGHGEVWFPIGIALLALIEPTNDLRFVASVLVLGVSDALASVVGLRYGRRKFYLVDRHWKTYLGSTTFFISTVIILAAVFANLAGISVVTHLWQFIVIAAVLTFVEALSSKGYDNVALPIATTLLLRLFMLE